jgi:hypothetical protein
MDTALGATVLMLVAGATFASTSLGVLHHRGGSLPRADASADKGRGFNAVSVTDQWRHRDMGGSHPTAHPTPPLVGLPVSGPIAPSATAAPPQPSGAYCPAVGFLVPNESPLGATRLAATLGVHAQVLTVYASDSPGGPYTAFTFAPHSGFELMLGVGAVTPAQATTIGDNLVSEGYANTMIRIMWEMNGNWFPWGTQRYSAAQYIAIYQAAERAFAAVPGNHFTYVWNVSAGTAEAGRTEFDTYPGNAYVSNVGIDVYNEWNDDSNVPEIISFAQSHGKPVSVDEWGMAGDDNPAYVDDIAAVVRNPANDVTLQAYFDDGTNAITDFPNSEAEYRKDFAGC